MSDLLQPGDHRAGELFSAHSIVQALIEVEGAWLAALAEAGIAPPEAAARLADVAADPGDDVLQAIARESEAGGNPVIPLLRWLRGELSGRKPAAATWLHRGLTSQDVLDTALVLCSRDVIDQVVREIACQVTHLRRLAGAHRHTPMAGRTLTQFAVPITFGLKAAGWLQGVLDAGQALASVRSSLRAQFGGAAGTLAAAAELAAQAGLASPEQAAARVAADAAHRLGLVDAPPWHTGRAPITRIGAALAEGTSAWGRIANDVLTLARPEIGELGEPAAAGRGASSAMPQKQNPVLSVLIRRTALTSPLLLAQLNLAAADAGDERPAGAWHAEWPALRTLARGAASAASQATELLGGLVVHESRMRQTLDAARPGILAEQLAVHQAQDPDRTPDGTPDDVPGGLLDPGAYLGTTQLTIDAVLARADQDCPEGT